MKTLWLFIVVLSFWVLFSLVSGRTSGDRHPRKILVFGGNGLLGSATVDRLIRIGDNVTIVNRGNWYYDSKRRIKPHVNVISCDRRNGINSCDELRQLVAEVDLFNAVIDFSAYTANSTRDAAEMLKNKAKILIHVSTDQVYDINRSGRKNSGLSEDDTIEWPDDPHKKGMIRLHYSQAAGKLDAEDAVREQRLDGGIPYIILRLPDVIGPRDTSYRFWMYQIWLKIYPHLKDNPVTIPNFIKNQPLSFVYSEDVGRLISELIDVRNPDVIDQVFNLAWETPVTIVELLMTIQEYLHLPDNQQFAYSEEATSNLFYPTSRAGPLDISKAQKNLNWNPSPWKQAVRETVTWYDDILKDDAFRVQLDEVVHIVASVIFRDKKVHFFKALEKAYDINLTRFWNHKDEL